ncbi:hypothetical protein NBRC116592_33270 [Colwellia sp. KU-HH00111]|uniref:hypothetical protein n=1 Tax=Colwellia sp. KU-HH00111 TaxID=3127652 RepID=UPI003105EA19
MSTLFKDQARCLGQMIDANNEAQAHLYLEQLLLLPVDVQDDIIEDVSQLKNCNSEAIATIIGHHTMIELR